jgi:hypothetical protein
MALDKRESILAETKHDEANFLYKSNSNLLEPL